MTPAAYAIVNLAAVRHNVKQVRTYAPGTKIIAVIKANGYGHGMLNIVNALENVDAVAVARSDEAIQLRQHGFTKKIIVLEGFVCQQELEQLLSNRLDVVIHSEGQLEILESYSGRDKINGWLKLDTGMNRLGFKPDQFDRAYQRIKACACVDSTLYLMTHLSSADDLLSHTTHKQISLFNENTRGFSEQKSIANSAAIIAWSEAKVGWVRPGLMLYGVSPFEDKTGVDLGLQPVMSLHSRLIAIKTVLPGESVGYAETWVSQSETKLGVVAIGYGDGYPRYARSGTPVLVNGQRVPLVGRVSMDMITIDLSLIKDVKVGDSVTLWGQGLPVEEIAKHSETIPYTLLCGITQRVDIKNVSRS